MASCSCVVSRACASCERCARRRRDREPRALRRPPRGPIPSPSVVDGSRTVARARLVRRVMPATVRVRTLTKRRDGVVGRRLRGGRGRRAGGARLPDAGPRVLQGAGAAVGVSRGGEAGLLIASTFPKLLHGAIGLVPGADVNPSPDAVTIPAWTYRGKPVPSSRSPSRGSEGPCSASAPARMRCGTRPATPSRSSSAWPPRTSASSTRASARRGPATTWAPRCPICPNRRIRSTSAGPRGRRRPPKPTCGHASCSSSRVRRTRANLHRPLRRRR
jgi:hypothetical protein